MQIVCWRDNLHEMSYPIFLKKKKKKKEKSYSHEMLNPVFMKKGLIVVWWFFLPCMLTFK